VRVILVVGAPPAFLSLAVLAVAFGYSAFGLIGQLSSDFPSG